MKRIASAPLSKPEYFNFADDVIDRHAKLVPWLVALYWLSADMAVSQSFTYAHFAQQSQRIAALLQGLGVRKGERLVIVCPRVPQWWEVAVACLRLSVVLCPATTLLVDKEIEYRCQKTDARVFVGDSESIKKFRRVQGNCPGVKHVLQVDKGGAVFPVGEVMELARALEGIPLNRKIAPSRSRSDDPALIYFTSGTSGPPKMVLHTHASYPLAHSFTGKHWLQLSPGNVYWNLAEQGWAKAAWAMFSAWNSGATLFIFDDRSPFSAAKTLRILSLFPIQTLCAPPTVYRQLVAQPLVSALAGSTSPFKRLAHCVSAGEPLNDAVVRQWADMTGLTIYEGYGQTETALLCGNFADAPMRPGSMGLPVPGVPLSVVDDAGAECAPGEEGDIALLLSDEDSTTPFFGLFAGYLDAADAGACVMPSRSSPTGRKWYSTGDRAVRDVDGYFFFVGRSDDVINSSGYRIGPFEVESALAAHPGVLECAVVSSPDPIRGEVVKAFVVLAAEWAERAKKDTEVVVKEVQAFCKRVAAPYKYPRKVQFVEVGELPKTVSGKVRRKELREREWEVGVRGEGRARVRRDSVAMAVRVKEEGLAAGGERLR